MWYFLFQVVNAVGKEDLGLLLFREHPVEMEKNVSIHIGMESLLVSSFHLSRWEKLHRKALGK